MQLLEVIGAQPEHSTVVYDRGELMLQRTLLLDERALDDAFERVPWARLVFLRCDRQKGGKRALSYRWRPEQPESWSTDEYREMSTE